MSAPPSGWPIVNETSVGLPASATFLGWKPTTRNVFAGAIVICGGELDEEDEQGEGAAPHRQSPRGKR